VVRRSSGHLRREREENPMKDLILDYITKEYLTEDEAAEAGLDEHTPLISSGIVDSFSMVSLKRFLEKQFRIVLPDAEATPQAFDTVAGIVALVERHQAKKGA
jgi:acyl carrier protein